MALTDLTRISTSGIATGSTIDSPILRKDVDFRGSQVGVTSSLFDSSDNALEFNDNVKIKLGNSGDLNIYHDGEDSIIEDSGTGSLELRTSTLKIKNSTNTKLFATANVNGVKLYENNDLKFETTGHGAVVTGILTASTFSGPLSNASGISTFYDLRVSNNLTVEGTTTTLDTNLIGVDRVEVGANSNSVVGVAITQSGTADLVNLFDGATKVVTVDSEGKVGIGTNNPTTLLTLAKDENPTLTFLDYTNNAKSQILGSAGGQLVFQTDINSVNANSDFIFRADSVSNEIVRFKDSGEVGIGTNNPSQKVDIFNGTDDPNIIFITGQDRITEYAGVGVFQGNATFTGGGIGGTNAGISLRTADGGTETERVRITGIGSVGIGTNAPDGQLHISSGAGANGDCRVYIEADEDNSVEGSNPFIIFKNDGGYENASVWCGNADGTNDNSLNLSAATATNGGIRFFTSTTNNGWETAPERLRISGIGSISIGSGVDGQRKVDIVTGGDNGVLIRPTTSTEGSQGSSGAIQDLIQLRNPWGSSAHNTGNAGARFGIQMRAFNGAGDFNTKDPAKSAAIYAVSEDEFSGYWKNVGLAFYTSAYNQSQAEKVRIDTNGKVGIGTNKPASALDVRNASGTNPLLSLHHSNADVEGEIIRIGRVDLPTIRYHSIKAKHGGAATNNYISFNLHNGGDTTTSQKEVLRIVGDGKVGIGQNNPATTLEIKSDAQDQTTETIPTLRITNDDGSASSGDITGSVEFFTEDTSDPNHVSGFIRNISETNAGFSYALSLGCKNASITGDAVEKLRITSDGKVGIGTDDPDAPLHVHTAPGAGTIAIFGSNDNTSGAQYEALEINNGVATYPALTNQASGDTLDLRSLGSVQVTLDANNNDNNTKYFRVSANGIGDTATELFRVHEDGKVGIGTNDPAGKLHISSGTSGDCELIIEADADNSNENDNPRILFRQDGGQDQSAVGTENNELVLSNSVSNGGIVFKTGTSVGYDNATEKLRITSGGEMQLKDSTVRYENTGGDFNQVRHLEFPIYFSSGTTHTVATIAGSLDSGFVAFATLEYIGLYGYAGQDMSGGVRRAYTRRNNNNSGWRNFNDQVSENIGENHRPDIEWDSGVLKVTTPGSVQITGYIRITAHAINMSNFTLTRN